MPTRRKGSRRDGGSGRAVTVFAGVTRDARACANTRHKVDMPAVSRKGGALCQRRRGCRVLCTRWGSALERAQSARVFASLVRGPQNREHPLTPFGSKSKVDRLRKRVNRVRIFVVTFDAFCSFFSSHDSRNDRLCGETDPLEKPKRRADRGAVVTVTGHTRPPPPPARPRTPSRGSVACRIWWFSSPSSWRRRARPRRPAPSSRRGTHKSCAPSACEVSGRRIASPRAPPGCARRASPAPPASSATPSIGSMSTVHPLSLASPPRSPTRALRPDPPPRTVGFFGFSSRSAFSDSPRAFPGFWLVRPRRVFLFVLFGNESTLTRSPPPPIPSPSPSPSPFFSRTRLSRSHRARRRVRRVRFTRW